MKNNRTLTKLTAVLLALIMVLGIVPVMEQTAKAATTDAVLDLSAPPNGGASGTVGRYTVDASINLITVTGTEPLTITGDGTNGGNGWDILIQHGASPITIENGTKIVGAAGDTYPALQCTLTVTIHGGGPNITISNADGEAISSGGQLTITGELGNVSGRLSAINAASGVNISGTVGNLSAATGIRAQGGNIDISGSVGNITVTGSGITATGSVAITGTVGNISVTGSENLVNAIYAGSSITLSGTVGEITTHADSWNAAIHANTGSININTPVTASCGGGVFNKQPLFGGAVAVYFATWSVNMNGTPSQSGTTYVWEAAPNPSSGHRYVKIEYPDSPAIAVTSTGLTGLKVGQPVTGSIVYTLSNGTYAATITPSVFAVTGLPAGLTAGTAVRTSNTVVTVPITGTPATANTSTATVTLPASIPATQVPAALAAITPTGTVTAGAVAKGDGLAATDHAINIVSTDTAANTFNLDTIVLNKTNAETGTRSYAIGAFTNTGSVLSSAPTLGGTNNATLTYQGAGQTTGSATQVITITTDNYSSTTVTITFNAVTKTDVSASISYTVTGSRTYTGLEQTVNHNATISGHTGGTWTYTYAAGDTPNGATLGATGRPLTAGNYKVTATWEDTANIGSVTREFAISKATPAGTPTYTAISEEGKTLNDAALTGTFSNPYDNSIVAGTLVWELNDTTEVTQGTSYTWVFTPTDTANYNNTTGNITLWPAPPPPPPPPGGGGGDPKPTSAPTPEQEPEPTPEPDPGHEPETTPVPEPEQGTADLIREIVNRKLAETIGLGAGSEDIENLISDLASGLVTYEQAAYSYFFGEEMQSKNLSDEEFIETLYNDILGRESDDAGMAHWLAMLQSDRMSREDIFEQFVNSSEFGNICKNAGIFPSHKAKIGGLIERFYESGLARDPDEEGLNAWVEALYSGGTTATQAAKEFFFGAEMQSKNLSDDDFIEALYNALLGRESDETGKTHWLAMLTDGATRETIFNAITSSQEFTGICTFYGISP